MKGILRIFNAKILTYGIFLVICTTVFAFGTGRLFALENNPNDFEILLSPIDIHRDGLDSTESVVQLLSKLDSVKRNEAMWPIYTFLKAEWLHAAQNHHEASKLYRDIIKHAYSDPQGDTWGGNGLVAFALWRWLTIQKHNKEIDINAFEKITTEADDLMRRRLVCAVFEPHPILPSLPMLEEEIYYLLALTALSLEDLDKAGHYYLRYLTCLRTNTYEAQSIPLYNVVIKQGIATADRIALFRGKRLFQLNQRSSALTFIKQAFASKNEEVRLEAAYLLARVSQELRREEKTKLYEEVSEYTSNKKLAQEAFYWNALQYGFNDPEFTFYLEKIIKEFPNNEYTDDALFWLGRREQIIGNIDKAIIWYQKIIDLKNDNDHASIAAYNSALGLIYRAMSPGSSQRKKTDDFVKAQLILKQFYIDYPFSILQPNIIFWLGRISEELGETKEASKWFKNMRR